MVKPSVSKNIIKKYLSQISQVEKSQLISDIQSAGLELKGKSPDGRFMEFTDRFGNVRVKIHPSDKATRYDHVHIYNKSGSSLNRNLEIVESTSLEAHVRIEGN